MPILMHFLMQHLNRFMIWHVCNKEGIQICSVIITYILYTFTPYACYLATHILVLPSVLHWYRPCMSSSPLTDTVLSLKHLTPPFVATSQTSPSCHCHTQYTFCWHVLLLHPHHSYFTPSSLSSVVKVYINPASTQDVLVMVSMFTVYSVRWATPWIITEVLLRPSAITVPLGHFTRYFSGQSALMGGADQPTTTLGGVATWRLGLVGEPGQAEQKWLEEVCYAEMAVML